jgi:tripartite-type tricarboxylate transporter receptor subunit TctC
MNRTNRRRAVLSVCAVLGAGGVGTAFGQGAADVYPSKTVTVVIPFAPGSTTESDARPVLQHLTETFGKPFVTDFRPGAGGTVGNGYVARATPDAHTLLVITTSFATGIAVREKPPYTARDFAPVSMLSRRKVILVVTPTLPVNTFPEYLAYAKANPQKLNWGTSGVGSIFHMAGAYLAGATGTQVTFVHYKGNSQGFIDLVAGRTHVSPMTTFAAQPYLKSGKVRPIAHLSAGRSRMLPDLPSVDELGVKGYDYSGWGAIVTTGNSPAAAVNKLAAAVMAYTRSPEAVARAIKDGYELEGSTPQSLGKFIDGEIARWTKVVVDNGIKLND